MLTVSPYLHFLGWGWWGRLTSGYFVILWLQLTNCFKKMSCCNGGSDVLSRLLNLKWKQKYLATTLSQFLKANPSAYYNFLPGTLPGCWILCHERMCHITNVLYLISFISRPTCFPLSALRTQKVKTSQWCQRGHLVFTVYIKFIINRSVPVLFSL